MINKYIYTKDMIKEYQNAWWNNEFKTGNISVGAIMIVSLLVLIEKIYKNDVGIFLVVLFIMCIMYFAMFFIKKNRAIKNELKKYEDTYKGKKQEIEIRLKDSIEIVNNKKSTKVSYDKIKKYIETKNLIILLVEGNMTIHLKKGGFINASDDECKKLLKEKLNKFNKLRSKKCIKRGKN